MLHILREIGIEQQDLRIIHNLYKNQTACIKKGKITTNAQIKKGVRQVCTLSPPHFNCYIEKAIYIVKAKLTRLNIGIKIGGKIVSMIRFADDIVVIAESEGDIQRAVEEMDEILRTSEMKINSTKTKILFCARNPKVKDDVYIGNQKLEQIEEMVYLGSKITSDGNSVHEIKQCIALAKIAFSKKHKLLTSKKIHLNIKKRLIKTYVWSIATYGCETRVINDTEKKKIEAFKMWCWMRTERISWIERKTNEVLRTVGEKRTLIDAIRGRCWKMVGHALRHLEKLHNVILEGMIEGKKTAGRRRNSYIGQIKIDAKVKTFKKLKEKARNRFEWRIGVVNQPSD
ncbi:uncharacterized protein LOC112685915 [Sipha flava]|uniref:Uncharacterized protein LOC112685915 n=2 Tax=Sipha flava TaxID=143950 RepID=A0A8B8FS20_9HEMI|nr:uncharacterized protein LOC112685915 [Sipha flava]